MLSRRVWFVFSLIVSIVAHALLIIVAPNVTVVRAAFAPPPLLETFRVQMRDDVPPPPRERAPEEAEPIALAARPDSIDQLLQRELDRLSPGQPLFDEPVTIPDLVQRAAAEPLPREHNFAVDDALFDTVDSRIIEISQDVARPDLQVARRQVVPSPTRVLEEGATPSLRAPMEGLREDVLDIDPLALPGGGGGGMPGLLGPSDFFPSSERAAIDAVEAATESAEPAEEPRFEPLTDEVVAPPPVVQAVRTQSSDEFLDEMVEIRLDAYMPPGEREGYFRVTIAPRKDKTIDVLPKDVTFVIDASNSIIQPKLKATADGVRRAIAALRPQDRFNVVLFRDSATQFRTDLVPASDANKAAAYQFLDGIEARGQTDVYQAIRPVVDAAPRRGIPGIVFVSTDGRPTTGLRDGRTIINLLTDENRHRNTIFAVGGGNTVNRPLLDLLALRNKGESHVTPRWQDIATDLPGFFNRLNDPILVNLDATYGQVNVDEVFPKAIPDFYRGQAVTVYGRFDPNADNEFYMRLKGEAGDRTKDILFKKDLRDANTGDQAIARNWARSKIYHLIGEMSRVGETPELLAEISALSRTYGIRTSYSEP